MYIVSHSFHAPSDNTMAHEMFQVSVESIEAALQYVKGEYDNYVRMMCVAEEVG